ncbi:MAG TPA: Gfo/Idh/MocA family oxidoreductase [Candidatus Sulfotelmatobacter sp.]|nr:Gfo/Idh/MocA family oxidoreductase [Candidatus Sulfotelmatobacter sp.]
MSKQKLRLAMIGSGFIGKVHSNAFRQVGHFFDVPYELQLKVICGRNRDKLARAGAQWGWDEVETDWQAVLGRIDIDAVDIAVPNALHAPIAIAAAAAGKIVFCEKPLAVSLEEAKSMAQAVGRVPNLVWFNYRRLPAVAFAKQLIEEGRMGQTFHYRTLYLNQSGNDPSKASGWRYQRSVAGTGATGDLLSHLIDLALYLNGPITELNAMTHTFAPGRDVDDAALLSVRFANRSIGNFEVSRYGVGYQNRNTFEINGSKGMLRFSLDDMNRLDFFDATEAPNLRGIRNIPTTGPNQPYWQNFWRPGHPIGYEHPFIATLADFLNAWARQEPFHVNFEDAVGVQRVLDAVERSAAAGNWVRLDKDF